MTDLHGEPQPDCYLGNHEFVPSFMRTSRGAGWVTGLTLDPKYPWQCRHCGNVIWKSFSSMVSDGWVTLTD